MAAPGVPNNFYVQQGNRQVYLSWDITAGATSYIVQRSTDGVNYSTIATVVVNNYLDTAVTAGIQYFYQVAANNGVTGLYTSAQSIIPTPTAEMSLGQLRLMSQQRADRVGSNFVTLPEWNSFINQAMYELYDLLITADEEYFVATPAQWTSQSANGSQTYLYPLPDGSTTFTNGITGNTTFIAPPFYKLKGVDLALNSAQNAWVTVNKFNFIDRNRFVYPNTASTIYGVFNLQYRLLGSNIELIPTPSAGQSLRIWYIPRLPQLLMDTDITSTGISGWNQYIIIRAAKYALDKEESDTSKLDQELVFLKQRIEETAVNRDTGQPDRISDVRQNGQWGSMQGGYGNGGPIGGF
jgi:hypothetical protein